MSKIISSYTNFQGEQCHDIYNTSGLLVHHIRGSFESSYEYDSRGRQIHYKDNDGFEYFWDYSIKEAM